MDDIAAAFDLPHARARATHTGAPLDRISVRDYVRPAEIGAFQPEHGVEQRLRFNVVLEVRHSAAAAGDDVDQVISYDTISEAIDVVLDEERVDLLETLAERIAARCLYDARAVRAFVRIEKLDRIAGALGIEIVRVRTPRGAAGADIGPPVEVVFLSAAALAADALGWLDAVARRSTPCVVCIAPPEPQPSAETPRQRRIGLLEIEQAALALAERDGRFEVVATATELDWALKHRRLSIWAPARMIEAAREGSLPDASAPLALAGWLARRLGGSLVVAGEPEPGTELADGAPRYLDPELPQSLTR